MARAAALLCALAAWAAFARAKIISTSGVQQPASVTEKAPSLPNLPLQFCGNITIIAHLVDPAKEYPPWKRKIELCYDYPNKKARSRVLLGYEANKTFLRRWDLKQEYVWKHGAFAECRRAYLSEPMSPPELPTGHGHGHGHGAGAARIHSNETGMVNNRPAVVWEHVDGPTRQLIFVDMETQIPVGVADEYWDTDKPAPSPSPSPSPSPAAEAAVGADGSSATDGSGGGKKGAWVRVMSYMVDNLVVGPPPASVWEIDAPYSHRECARHLGGWPYLHVFHWFLRV